MTTPTLSEGMNNEPPSLGMAFLCTLRVLGKSKSSCVLHIFTKKGVQINEKTRLIVKAVMMYA